MKEPKQMLGAAAIIASIGVPLAQVLVPVAQEVSAAKQQLMLDQVEAENAHRIRVADILLNSYIGQNADDQHGALVIIATIFPTIASELQEALVRYAKDDEVRNMAESLVAQANGVEEKDLRTAQEAEQAGLDALEQGDINTAIMQFDQAYDHHPNLGNVSVIRQQLDTLNKSNERAVRATITRISRQNQWRLTSKPQAR